MTSLPDAERDADDVVQALARLAAILGRSTGSSHEGGDHLERMTAELAEDGAAAARVLAYLRELRGPGDGAAATVPHRLGPWREWVPTHGGVLGRVGPEQRIGELPQTRRADPGE